MVDTHDATDGAAVVNAAVQAFGGLHVLVNNAGIMRYATLSSLSRSLSPTRPRALWYISYLSSHSNVTG